MFALILKALLLQPHPALAQPSADLLARTISYRVGISHSRSLRYARYIVRESRRRHVSAFLVAGLFHRESRWNHRLSKKSNYGLGQVRVSRTTNPHLIGREHLLFNPSMNTRYSVRSLARWRAYHFKRCPATSIHVWWSHYQWGSKPLNNQSAYRVLREYWRYKKIADKLRKRSLRRDAERPST